MPVFNSGRFLQETIFSIRNQTESDWECIMWNDGSTDDSWDIMQEAALLDERFKVINSPANSASADWVRGEATALACSPLCCNIDSDDLIEEAYLEKMLCRQIQTSSDVVCSLTKMFVNERSDVICCIPQFGFDIEQVLSGPQACSLCIDTWRISMAGVLYKTSLNKKLERGRYMNSDEFTSRQLLFKSHKVAFCNAEYYYRYHSDSTVNSISIRQWDRVKVARLVERFVYANYVDLKTNVIASRSRFTNLMHLTALAYIDTKAFDTAQIKRVRDICKSAFYEIKEEGIIPLLPPLWRIVASNYLLFRQVSVFYERYLRFSRK